MFLSNLSAKLPFLKKAEKLEYFFGLNIGLEKIKACLWTIEGGKLKVINPVSADYKTSDEILDIADKLLDQAVGAEPYEPEKLLFGVPDSYLVDDELKDEYLKLIRTIVKSLEITPMAYVSTSHGVSHLLDKKEGGPTTAILVDIGKEKLSVSVSRAGKIDGTKVLARGENLAGDVEKGLLSFTDIEVLPSRILIYGYSKEGLEKQKETLLSFPWMGKLPFLHFPKIEILDSNTDITAVSLAGAVEIDPDVKFTEVIEPDKKSPSKLIPMEDEEKEVAEEETKPQKVTEETDTGFVTGDIAQKSERIEEETVSEDDEPYEENIDLPAGGALAVEEEETDLMARQLPSWVKLPKGNRKFIAPLLVFLALIAAYLLLPQANVIIFVEPKVLEKDAQVIADPTIKVVDEVAKKIPGQSVETQVSGTDKASATGKKQVGDPARGKVIIYNGTDALKTFSAGTALTGSGGVKFTLTSSATVASKSASQTDPLSTVSGKSDPVDVTASTLGADGNISSGTAFSVGSFPQSQIVAKAEGNFSGGTSKDVTAVTDADQKKLLAQLASSLRKKAQEDIQGKLTDERSSPSDKKILEEGLTETIVKKTYSKGINDQASEFSLNLIVKYSGIAYSDADLKTIVAKLVDTSIPEGYELDLSQTETQADVSKMEKNQLIFLARFKAKLAPKLDLNQIKNKLRGQSPARAGEILRGYESVLESEVKMMPSIPPPLARLPWLASRIKVEVKLK